MSEGSNKAPDRTWRGGFELKKDNPESSKDRDNWVVAHPLQIAPEQWGMNAETDVSLSTEGAVCKNLPTLVVESVNIIPHRQIKFYLSRVLEF